MDIGRQIALYPTYRPASAGGRGHGTMSLPIMSAPITPQARDARLSIGFINWAHALDHYVMLIFPTVVIGLELIYGRSYAELIALGTASASSRCRPAGLRTAGAGAT
jgi:hypothetical protein